MGRPILRLIWPAYVPVLWCIGMVWNSHPTWATRADRSTEYLVFHEGEGSPLRICLACENATNGGLIAGDESGCPDPIFDPGPITNVQLPTGGTGVLEYVWIYTTDDPSLPGAVWEHIPNSNTPELDPGPITQTTWYRRCARRSGCVDYVAESNIVVKEVSCCSNVSDGGLIGFDQQGCGVPFDPLPFANVVAPSGGVGDIEYVWYTSVTGSPFVLGNPDWVAIPNSDTAALDMGPIIQTTWFVRLSRRAGCNLFLGQSNIIMVEVLPGFDLSAQISGQPLCPDDSVAAVSLTISGGVAPFDVTWSTGHTTLVVDSLPPGQYEVSVTDSLGCAETLAVNIDGPAPLQILFQTGDETCAGREDGYVIAQVQGGTSPYAYTWDNGLVTDSLTDLSPGMYCLTVSDANGCSTASCAEVLPAVPIAAILSSTPVQCAAMNDGVASVDSVWGGTPPYSFQWDDPLGQTTAQATNLSAGLYRVTIQDERGCQRVDSIVVDQLNPITVFISVTPATCMGYADGAAVVYDVQGGVPPYTYQWNDPLAQSTAQAINLAPGFYEVSVTDANGCMQVAQAIVPTTLVFDIQSTVSAPTCWGGADGAISIDSVMGGMPPYTFAWSTGDTVQQLSGLTAGQYELTVSDAQGCQTLQTFIIGQPDSMVLEVQAVGPACAGQATGFAVVDVVSGGTAPFSYQWNDPDTQTSATAFGLSAGVYAVTVTDALGCQAVATAILSDGVALITQTSATDNFCESDTMGTATAVVESGQAPFSYQWSDAAQQTTPTATGLTSGTYIVTVTDANGCQAVDTAIVGAQVALGIMVLGTDISCFGAQDGMATVVVANANVNNLVFEWNIAGTDGQQTITNLAPGTYMVTVTDTTAQCSVTGQTTIDEPTLLDLSMQVADESCAQASDGSVLAIPQGGTLPYAFNWSNGDTTQTITDLAPGTYVLTLTDARGCQAIDTAVVAAGPALSLSVAVQDATCPNTADGVANVQVLMGQAPFVYEWSDALAQNTSQATGLAPGDYSVTVTDSIGCNGTAMFTIGSQSDLNVVAELMDISCAGMANGSIAVHATGGGGSYNFSWSGVAATDSIVTGLGAGTYSVTVSSADGCALTLDIALEEPLPLLLDVVSENTSCPNSADGSAIALPAGGTMPYTYQWNDPAAQTTQAAVNLPQGTWQVTVTDANGCTATAGVTIAIDSDFSLTLVSTDALCVGTATGSAAAIATGGQPPYTYQWDNSQTTAQIDNLMPGWYVVSVTDLLGCTLVDSVEIAAPMPVSCAATVVQPISGYGLSDGIVSVSASGGTLPYQYEWNTGDTTQQVTALSAGIYEVTVVDANGCQCVHAVSLDNPSRLGNRVWLDANENGIQDNGEAGIQGVVVVLTGQATNGQPIHDTTQTDANGLYWFDGLPAGNYQVRFFPQPQHTFTLPQQGNDPTLDSDPDPSSGTTDYVSLPNASSRDDIDAGLIELDEPMNIGDRLWHDFNRNGIQDPAEEGIGNALIELRTWPDMTLVASALTSTNGLYLFSNVEPGQYVLVLDLTTLPQGYVLTQPNVGNDTLDSDFDPITGQTSVIEVLPYQPDNLTIDAGAHAECENVTDGGLIAGDEVLCGPGSDPAPIVNVVAPSGGVGNIEYLWLVGTSPQFNGAGDPNWTPIPNSNTPDYDPGPLTQTRWFIRCARREGCSTFVAESNIVVKEIVELPLTQIIQAPDTACVSSGQVFAAANAGGGATYAWQFGLGAVPPTSNLRVVPDVYWTQVGNQTVQLAVMRLGCTDTTYHSVVVQNCPSPLAVYNLTAEIHNGQTVLTWFTESDDAQTWFQVDYSQDGLQWEALALLEGESGPGIHIYTWLHAQPILGENWYRIRHFRSDGTQFTTQPVRVDKLIAPDFLGFRLYPNPARGVIQLFFDHELKENTPIQLATVYGVVVHKEIVPAHTQKWSINVSDLPAGTYNLFVAYPYRRPVSVLLIVE